MSDGPRLFLITPPVADARRFMPLLEAAVGAADIACVLLRTAARDDGETKALIRTLAPTVQDRGAALLVEHDPRLAARVDADGVLVQGAGTALAEAIAALQPRKIVGAGALASRDTAMRAGEIGADFVMFGAPGGDESHEEVLDRATWWAAIFNMPCVAYAHHPDLAVPLARTGAEFVALCEGFWDVPATMAATLRTIAAAMANTSALLDEARR